MHSTRSNFATVAANNDCSVASTTSAFNVAPPAYDTIVVNGNTAANVATSPSPVGVAPPAYGTVVATPMTREEFMKTFVSSIDSKIGGMDKDAQIKSLRTTVIGEHGRVFDLVKKANHLLGARIQDIRRRDMNIRALQQQNHNLNAQMIALKRHYAMNPHASKINQWMQSGQVERIVLRPQGTISRVPATITRSNTREPTRAARRVAPMVQRLGSQTVNGRRVAQRVNLEQEVAHEQVNQARRAAQLRQQIRIETARREQLLARHDELERQLATGRRA
ncbi:hypothetical protein D6C86_05974 [Aureobasidium pullulans]|uniref:Uncharacterized protein n=1 Tax=Aureobasidium pullulans TaxID=5580 RepID=A0A4S9V7K6_AURPU|nr:hypothetical protein D6C94_06826 [Aureobasidium pullulans]THZ47035.1 hypothetical protein D6C87_01793 [Aureobasidium pullulans]THZ59137.1 hypothetical protein D6C86_05974 [Aureobasidium pullulans]TIA08778.1 hypothetical protein D6C83_08590 [Aureobasidium pullulans]